MMMKILHNKVNKMTRVHIYNCGGSNWTQKI